MLCSRITIFLRRGVAVPAAAATVLVSGAFVQTGAAQATGGSQTVRVIEHAITDTEIPTAGKGDQNGNILVFHNPIYNAANKTVVGHDEGFCNRINVKDGIWECLWTTFLPGGQLTVQGPYYDTRDSDLTITGGTGKYSTARGYMALHAFDGSKEYDFTFHIER